MRIRAGLLLVAVLFAGVGCAGTVGRPGDPEPAPDAWRGFVGCYQVGDNRFALDTVPETELYADVPGVRQARFEPPAIVRAYWFVNERGVLWVFRHDGLWGTSYELTARGDSLVGRRWVRTDVPTAKPTPTPATAVRTPSCPAQPGAQ